MIQQNGNPNIVWISSAEIHANASMPSAQRAGTERCWSWRFSQRNPNSIVTAPMHRSGVERRADERWLIIPQIMKTKPIALATDDSRSCMKILLDAVRYHRGECLAKIACSTAIAVVNARERVVSIIHLVVDCGLWNWATYVA